MDKEFELIKSLCEAFKSNLVNAHGVLFCTKREKEVKRVAKKGKQKQKNVL